MRRRFKVTGNRSPKTMIREHTQRARINSTVGRVISLLGPASEQSGMFAAEVLSDGTIDKGARFDEAEFDEARFSE